MAATNFSGPIIVNGVTVIDENGNIDAPVTTTDLTTTGNTTLGDGGGTNTLNDATTINATLTVGVDDTGYDVKLFGATSGKYWLWDESADKMIVTGASDLLGNTQQTGTFTVGVDDTGHDVTFYGATAGQKVFWDESADTLNLDCTNQIDGTVTVGVDDTGYDVKFFGATTGKYMLWDESADKLIVVGTTDAGTSCEADAYTVGGVAGVDFGPAAPASITVVKGIVTAASA